MVLMPCSEEPDVPTSCFEELDVVPELCSALRILVRCPRPALLQGTLYGAGVLFCSEDLSVVPTSHSAPGQDVRVPGVVGLSPAAMPVCSHGSGCIWPQLLLWEMELGFGAGTHPHHPLQARLCCGTHECCQARVGFVAP